MSRITADRLRPPDVLLQRPAWGSPGGCVMKSVAAGAAAVVLVLCWGTPEAVHSSGRALVFRNVDVFDGSRMLRKTTVLVSGGMVRAVGPEAAVPPAAEVVDGTGKSLLPGLFDAHTHLGAVYGEQFLRDALRFGVT